jgi:hypothetical protein
LLTAPLRSGTASADVWSVHATLAGQVAATDNVFSVPANSESDLFVQLRPGVLAVSSSRRLIQELSAEAEILEYARHSSDPSLSGRGGWRAVFALSPTTEGLASVVGGTGTVSALSSRATADQGQLQILPAGNVDVSNVDASARLGHELGEHLRVFEGATARWNRVSSVGTRLDGTELGVVGGLGRGWLADALALEIGLGFSRYDRVGQPLLLGTAQELSARVTAQWRHDLDLHWTTDVDGGLAALMPTGAGGKSKLLPLLGGSLAYGDDWGRATLAARRAVGANLLVGQSTVNDTVSANLHLPLPVLEDQTVQRRPLTVGATIGAGRTQFIDLATGSLAGTFALYRAEVGLTYAPAVNLGLGLRYEYARQGGDTVGALVVPGFSRSTVYLSFTARWPSERVAELPNRNAVRADGADTPALGGTPAGASPTDRR